jgi:hypothetical protein
VGQQTVAGDIQSAHHDGKLFFDHPSPEAMRSNLLPSGSRKLRAALRSWYARKWAKTTAQILILDWETATFDSSRRGWGALCFCELQ